MMVLSRQRRNVIVVNIMYNNSLAFSAARIISRAIILLT